MTPLRDPLSSHPACPAIGVNTLLNLLLLSSYRRRRVVCPRTKCPMSRRHFTRRGSNLVLLGAWTWCGCVGRMRPL